MHFKNAVRNARWLAVAMSIASFAWAASAADDSEADGEKRVKAAHELGDPNARTDEFGLTVPIPISHPGRRYPADMDFPTGPDVGERLPDFELPNQRGEMINLHKSRGGNKAAVVFYRSAVW